MILPLGYWWHGFTQFFNLNYINFLIKSAHILEKLCLIWHILWNLAYCFILLQNAWWRKFLDLLIFFSLILIYFYLIDRYFRERRMANIKLNWNELRWMKNSHFVAELPNSRFNMSTSKRHPSSKGDDLDGIGKLLKYASKVPEIAFLKLSFKELCWRE